ncbi:GNAT family N-acetyltransferase [Ktedonosporobacter rubrisoli]|nr:GNAT family N-acetyltransferase [Ktedonosporobacter rubrisoli]
MIVRLHSLSVRPPVWADLSAVVGLIKACVKEEAGIEEPTEEEVHKSWQARNFNLRMDAWVIFTRKGDIVGYAEVRNCGDGRLVSMLRVHPAYRGRGIGTLLTWLVEERARQLMRRISLDIRVTLSNSVNSLNTAAHRLLEREGYSLVRNFWRLSIEMDEQLPDEGARDGKIQMDLVIDSANLMGSTRLPRRTGMYVVRQYDVYEKVLRIPDVQQVAEEQDAHYYSVASAT